jgi:hypothetical protein
MVLALNRIASALIAPEQSMPSVTPAGITRQCLCAAD